MTTRHTNSPLFRLSFVIFILTVALSFGSDALSRGRPGLRLAKLAAGSYLVDVSERSEKYLFMFGPDGRMLSEDTNDFGDGVPAAYQSAFYGTWAPTGRRTLVYTALAFAFDASGVNVTLVRHSAKVVFDEKFQRFHQEGTFAVFAASQDPLDPEELPIATGTFSGTGRRIPAVVE